MKAVHERPLQSAINVSLIYLMACNICPSFKCNSGVFHVLNDVEIFCHSFSLESLLNRHLHQNILIGYMKKAKNEHMWDIFYLIKLNLLKSPQTLLLDDGKKPSFSSPMKITEK